MFAARRLLQAASHAGRRLPSLAEVETLEALEGLAPRRPLPTPRDTASPQPRERRSSSRSSNASNSTKKRASDGSRSGSGSSSSSRKEGSRQRLLRNGPAATTTTAAATATTTTTISAAAAALLDRPLTRREFREVRPADTTLARLAARLLSPKHSGRGKQLRAIERGAASLPAVLTADAALPGKLRPLGASTNPETFVPEQAGVAEVAVVGRSNVGKSTLLNALTEAAPARADDRPGVTRAVHVYELLPKLRIVDLPGYGFAFGKEASRTRWNDILLTFLATRARLSRVFVLVDARHGLKANDRDFLAFLESSVACRYQLVFTKCDLVPLEHLARRMDLLTSELAAHWPKALPEVRAGVGARRPLCVWLF